MDLVVDTPDHKNEHAGTRPSRIIPSTVLPRKASNYSLSQQIKEAYNEVEKGKRGYKVASIQDGAVCLDFQLIAGNIVRKNRPTQVTRFMVDIIGKCMEGMQMKWESYLVNELERDYREVQDQGYEFHFNSFLLLITFCHLENVRRSCLPRD
jgi:hypothetical protein